MFSARPDVQSFLDMMKANAGPSIIEIDPAIARAMARQMAPLVELPAREMRRTNIVIPAQDGPGIPARIYHPVEISGPAPVMVYFHGGGWVLGDVDGYDPLCSEIAYLMGMTLVSVDYRLGPEHLFPAAVDDCRDATLWVAANQENLGHEVSGLILAGDSAGGALAAVIARELVGKSPMPVLAQWLIYPVTDVSTKYPSDLELSDLFMLNDAALDKFLRYYLGTGDIEAKKRHPQVSPIFGETWRGLPPAVVFTCSLDPLRDQGRAYAAKLISNGVGTIFYEGEGQVHGSFTMRKLLPSTQGDLLNGIKALKLLLGRIAASRASDGV